MKKFIISLCALFTSLSVMAANPQVELLTNQGRIVLELDQQRAPATVANFLQYVKNKHYDGLIFHRVIDNFMIQGGGFTPSMQEKSTQAPINNEADNGLKNDAYTIAMARTSDPHSATSQFFINVKDNDFLNFKSKTPQGWGYAVFGKVTQGKEVVDKIKAVKTGSFGPFGDVPQTPIIIQTVKLIPASK